MSALLRRAPKVKLLLTCRKSVGVADELPLTIHMEELSREEAKHMLQSMAPRVPHTHALELCALCGNMPLALRLCGCALASQRVPISADARAFGIKPTASRRIAMPLTQGCPFVPLYGRR